jgi:hypothetical protein
LVLFQLVPEPTRLETRLEWRLAELDESRLAELEKRLEWRLEHMDC